LREPLYAFHSVLPNLLTSTTYTFSKVEETSGVEAQAASGVESSVEKTSGAQAQAASGIDEQRRDQRRPRVLRLKLIPRSTSPCRNRRGLRVLRHNLILRSTSLCRDRKRLRSMYRVLSSPLIMVMSTAEWIQTLTSLP
jgi:hypothetical protein